MGGDGSPASVIRRPCPLDMRSRGPMPNPAGDTVADLRAAHSEPLLIQLAHVISGAPCRHCGSTPYGEQAPLVPAARVGEPATVPAADAPALEEMGDDEQWLWRLADEADRVLAAAPVGPAPEAIFAADVRYAQTVAFEERILNQIRLAERAIARPGSWLRPSFRAAIVKQLRHDRSTAVMAAMRRSRAAEVRDHLRELSMRRAGYLSEHRLTIAAGANARTELNRLLDDVIDEYSRMTPPPTWFRFGLGFPPEPGTYATWLHDARAEVARRRRRTAEIM